MSKLQNIRQKVRASLLEEAEKMRALGATDADTREESFIVMVSRRIADELFHELGPEEFKELWQNFIKTASPEKLREAAKALRAKGEDAYDLEHLADLPRTGRLEATMSKTFDPDLWAIEAHGRR
jgi:hypothetical protein